MAGAKNQHAAAAAPARHASAAEPTDLKDQGIMRDIDLWAASRARAHTVLDRCSSSSVCLRLRSGAVLAALEHALALVDADDAPSSWLLLAQAHLAMGSVSAVRSACVAAAARGADIAQFSSELNTYLETWIDHPARLGFLFPEGAHREGRGERHSRLAARGLRHDGCYAATPAVSIAWSIFLDRGATGVPRGVVLYFHGNGENADFLQPLAHQFHQMALALMVVEFRGYGNSSRATPLLSTLCTDAEPLVLSDALDEALRQASLPKATPVICFGRSLGGHVAVHIAAIGGSLFANRVRPCALVLDSATASVRNWTRVAPPGSKAQGPPIPGGVSMVGLLENMQKLSGMTVPLLVLHGSADAIVPPFQAKLLYDASAAPEDSKHLLLFPGCGHNDLAHHPKYWPSVARFVEGTLAPLTQGR
uniref:Serine aminopeptidase S33 domain-containing protein n=1 Tax=Calcidiscus leptoporus TaxID=127549 RepID=A0A7S0P6Z3_9EUKA